MQVQQAYVDLLTRWIPPYVQEPLNTQVSGKISEVFREENAINRCQTARPNHSGE
jgi:hypothetical protein